MAKQWCMKCRTRHLINTPHDMTTTHVSLSSIVVGDRRKHLLCHHKRVMYETELNTLCDSIAMIGQVNPMLVIPHPSKPAKFQLVEGYWRLKALKLIQKRTKRKQTAFVTIAPYQKPIRRNLVCR